MSSDPFLSLSPMLTVTQATLPAIPQVLFLWAYPSIICPWEGEGPGHEPLLQSTGFVAELL